MATSVRLTTTMLPQLNTCMDMFDIVDQEHEIEQDHNEKLMWEKIREEFNMNYQFDNTYENMQEHDDEEFFRYIDAAKIEREKIFEEEELFTSLTTNKTTRTTDAIDLMPAYLSGKNRFFDHMIQRFIGTSNQMDVDDLRQMAFFQHQIVHFNELHHLWSVYLRAGIGSLKENEQTDEEHKDVSKQIDRRYWCQEVKSFVGEQFNLTQEEKDRVCQDIVYRRLQEYSEKKQLYEQQFNRMKQDLSYWTFTIEEGIQTFVQQYGMNSLRIQYKHQIAVLTCEYEDQILQRRYEQQQNPTTHQKRLAEDFYEAEYNLEAMKIEFVEYQERIRCNKPPTSYGVLEIPLLSSIQLIANQDVRQQLSNRYENLLQQTKTDLLAVHLTVQQTAIYQYQIVLEEKQLSVTAMTKALSDLIQQRSLNMKHRFKLISDFTINHDLRSAYHPLALTTETQDQSIEHNRFLSHLLVDSTMTRKDYLADRQLQLLSRGPAYIAPGQLHVLFSNGGNNETMNMLIKKQYAPLKHQLAVLFDRYRISVTDAMNFQANTLQVFQNLYSRSLPEDIDRRATHEKRLIRSIQTVLEKNNLILRRTADQTNTFYLGHQQDFLHRCHQYMEDHSDTYSILFNLNQINLQTVQEQLKKRYLAMNSEIDKLFQEKKLTSIIHHKLKLQMDHVKIPYLYFLPTMATTDTVPVHVQPMISAHRSMTSKLAQFLKQILRPILLKDKANTTLINEADFMKKFLHYIHQERALSPTTLFATVRITNFDTMASHESLIRRLNKFLVDRSASNHLNYTMLPTVQHIQRISIDTIKKLTELYLENNIFYYDGNIYELQKSTGPTSLLLSELLSNIYLLLYDQHRFDNPQLKTEFYGRYKDHIFFTWNRSAEELQLFLACLPITYPHIQMQTSMGTSVQFLNAQIENRAGHLYTNVYHASSRSKYTLPYVIDHVKLNHSLWFRSALIRAVRFCTNVHDFNQEQIYLMMACLSYGYSVHLIETQLKHFFFRFNIDRFRCCSNQTVYEQQLRSRLFDFVDVQHSRSEKYQELEDKEYLFHFSYPYNFGAYDQFHRQFQELWKKHFKYDTHFTHKDTSIVLVPQSIYSLNTLLSQQKPCHELMKTSKTSTL